MRKDLSKAKYIDFVHKLTGHSKIFIEKNLKIQERPLAKTFVFTAGTLSYYTWIDHGRIYTQCFLENECQCAWYHNFDTFEYDWKFTQEVQYE